MENTVTNVTYLVGSIGTISSGKKPETDTISKSISEEYLCKYIEPEDNIKDNPVPLKVTGEDFFACTVSNDMNENSELDSEERRTAYRMDDVHYFDDFISNADDNYDNIT